MLYLAMVSNYGHTSVSKSRFKAHALELFRQVESTGTPIIITDHGKPVLKLAPFRDDAATTLRLLRETVTKYDAPTDPVGDADWDADR